MSKLEEQLEEDRALRNSARRLFRKELDHARREFTPTNLGERLGDDIGSQVDRASDHALDFTERHGGKIAASSGALAAGIGLWLARRPILARLAPLFSKGEAAPVDNAPEEIAAIEDSHNE